MTGSRPSPRSLARLLAAAALALAACHEGDRATPSLAGIHVSTSSLATAEGGGPVSFDVVLLTTPTDPVDVEVRSDDPGEGLVLAPGYAAPSPVQQLGFTPGDWDVPRRVVVHPVDDHVADGTVSWAVRLTVAFSEDGAYAAAPPVSVRVANADDDAVGLVLSTDALVTQERGGARRFSVRLATVPTSSVAVTAASGDASEGLLVEAGASGGCASAQQAIALAFGPTDWDLPRCVDVCPQDDPDPDGDRTYAVTLQPSGFASEYAALPPAVVTVTNADDETGYTVAADEPLVTGEDGTTATFTVVLNAPPAAAVVIPVTSGNPAEGLVASGGLGPAASVALTFTPASWAVPQVVTVVGQDDLAWPVPLDDVRYDVTVGPPGSSDPAFAGLAARAVAVVNLDEDVPPAIAVAAAGPLVTDEAGGTATFAVSLSRSPPGDGVTVLVTSGDASEGLVRGGSSPDWPQQEITLTFTELDWRTPRTVTVVGQRDGWVDGDQGYEVTVGPVTGDARYAGLPSQAVPVTNRDLDSAPGAAVYDAVLHAPRCALVGSSCDSGTLLDGRGAMNSNPSLGLQGPESNAPNTIGSPACPDGNSGTYHQDESLDRLSVSTVDGSGFAPGKQVDIAATVWVWDATTDSLDVYASADANAPAWTYLGTLRAVATGAQVITTRYTLPAGTLQAIRAGWRYQGSPSECTDGSYDDHDDLVFAVAP